MVQPEGLRKITHGQSERFMVRSRRSPRVLRFETQKHAVGGKGSRTKAALARRRRPTDRTLKTPSEIEEEREKYQWVNGGGGFTMEP